MNDNSLGIREVKSTVVKSELDIIMQSYIDSGQFTKEQLAEMRKAEANKLKEAKAAEKQRAEIAKSGPIEGSQVEAFNEEVDGGPKPTTPTVTPTKTDKFKDEYGGSVDIFDMVDLYKEKKQEKLVKNTTELDKKHEKLGTQQKLIDQFGTSDRDKIIANALTNEDGSLKSLPKGIMKLDLSDRDDKTYLNPNNLPMFDDEDMMEYLYAPYMEDAETMTTGAMDFVAGIFGADTDYATPENERQKKVLQDRFSSSNTDRSGILDYIKAKQSNYRKEQFDTQYELGESFDVATKEWVDVSGIAGKDKETFELIQNGEGDKAAQLNEDRGFYTLYNKDGKYINWTELSDEDKANADPNNISRVSKEDEERAKILSERHKPAKLQMQQMQNRHDLVAATNMYRETFGDASVNIDPLGDRNIGYFGSVDDFNTATLSAAENNSLMGGLVEAVGDDEVTQQYNEALKKYLITGRALELNQDLSKLAEEGSRDIQSIVEVGLNVKEFLFAPDEFADYTADEQVEAFGGYMEETGAVMNDDWKRVTREGGDWLMPGGIEMFGSEVDIREVTEGGRDFVKHIAPLVASLYITKKIPLGLIGRMDKAGKAYRVTRSAKTLGGQVSKGATNLGKWIKQSRKIKGVKVNPFNTKIGRLVTDLTIGGAEELLYLSIADQVGGKLFDMDPMVYDPKEDNLNWEFAFGLGVGNVLGKKVIGRLMNTQRGAEFMGRVSKYNTLEKAFERSIGATSGVGSMEIAKAISGDSELMKLYLDPNSDLSESERNEMKLGLVKTMASDWLGMFMLGYITPGGKVGEALSKDIENFSIEKLNTSKDAKKLGIKEDASPDQVEAAVYKKKAEATKKYLKSGKTEKDAQTRDKELAEIKKAEDNIDGRASIRAAKELISKDKKRLAEVEREVRIYNKKITSGKELSGKDILKLTSMNKNEFNYLLKKMNNKQAAEMLNAKREFYKASVEYVKEFGNISSRKESIKLLEEVVNYHSKKNAIDYLKSSNDKGKNDAKIKKLKEELEPIEETHKESLKSLEKKYEEAVNKEMLVAKAIAKGLGAEFEIAKSTEDYLKKANDPEAVGTAGFHMVDPKTGKSMILVDPVKAASVKTIGTGIHETVHHILKDAFKEKYTEGGVEKTRISKEGVAIIDKFLESLGEKDRKVIDKELSERYRDKKVEIPYRKGVESYEQKSKYYEEVLTTYVEALKNKQITLDLPTGQRIQNVFLPHINKVFPNVGKKTVEMFDAKDANNLKGMLNDIFLESERLGNMSKYEVKDLMKDKPVKTADAWSVFTEVSEMNLSKAFSKYPEMKKINAVGEKYTRQEWKDGKWMEGYEEILPEIIKVLTKKSFEANAKYPGIISDPQSFAFQVANELGGLNSNQQKVGGHVRNFDIEKKTYDKEGAEFGLSGWINNVADLKLLNVLKRADKIIGAKKTKSLDVEDFKELVYEGPSAIDIIETKMSDANSKRVLMESEKAKIHELMADVQRQKGEQAKQIHDGIRQKFTKDGVIDVNKLMETVSGKKMKNLPVLVLPETINLFVGDKALAQKIANKIEKKANLDGKDIKALQNGLNRWIPMIAEYVIPEGFITKEVNGVQVPGETTGVPRKIQAITHNKRSMAGVTTIDGTKVRSKENFFGQYKKPMSVELYENLREAIGIMKDGTRNLNTRNNQPVKGLEGVGETLKGVISLTERMFTSQGLREPMYSMGKIFEPEMLAIADGKPQKSFSNIKTKDLLEDLQKKSKEYAIIQNRIEKGEGFNPLMMKEVFGDETGAMREHLEQVYAERKGLTVDKNVLPLESVEKLNLKEQEAFDKEAAKSTSQVAIKNNVDGARVSLANVNKSTDLIKQRSDHHVVVLNRMPFHHSKMPKESLTALLTEFGWGSKSRKEVLKDGGEGFYLKQTGTSKDVATRKSETLDNYYGKDKLFNNEKAYDGRYDACFVPKDFGKLKRNVTAEANRLVKLVNSGKKSRRQAEMDLVDFVRAKFSSNKKSSGYETTVKANEALAKDFYIARFKAAKAEGTKTIIVDGKKVKINLGLENILVHNAMQSNHSTGITKAMVYNLETIAFEGSKPGTYKFENAKGELKEYKTKEELHWEHERQLLNTNEHWVNLVNRHKKVTPEMLNELDVFIETSTQSLIEKTLQLKNDAKGNTTYSDKYTGNLAERGMLNVLTRKGVEHNQLVMSGPYKGRRLSEKLAGEYTMKQMKDVLSKLPKDFWGPEAYTVEATNLKNHKAMVENNNKAISSVVGKNYSKLKGRDPLKDLMDIAKATNLGRLSNKKARGMSTFDFDETVGVSENYVIATKGKEKKRIASNEWPFVGDKLINEGWKMDFTDFNKVTKGKPGPLMQKMKNQIEKYGPENVFILTARAPESQRAIHEYLKSEGIKIPLKNVTGLGNSTGEAKALWMLEKFAEGYNDMYFVDDALPNVKAVKDVLDQLDIKSNVQIAKQFNRTKLSKSFNDILQQVEGVKSEATFSEAKGRLVGEKKGKFRFGTPGMEDFAGLVTYKFAGKGKQGEAHKKFFEDNLQRPFSRAYNEINIRKQSISEDYKALRKAMPEARKLLGETVDGIYTVDQAIRVYNFKKAGYEAPGLSKTDSKKLISYVESNPKLVAFADQLSKITMLKEGYVKPVDYWLGENITMDMNNVVDRVFRKEALAEFVENRKEIFGEWKGGKLVGENMSKIEALYGPRHREALENMLWRMENGTNRRVGADSATNKWMNWINSATGTIMFFNQKSAALQTISSLNYVNGTFNNPLRAAQAFANQPQYWKDFVFLFNSPMMLQRRSGLKINIEAAELLERVGGKEGGFARFRAYVLEKGFIPTKYADSFAIASGGATFYRNSIRKYKKQGMSEKEAQQRAFEDFQQMTEATQQSSRPDLISMQQASGLGRPILAFANTPMQMFRRHKRRLQDIANRRGNTAENVLSAVYYGFAQTMIFSYLANAMFAVDDESEDEDDKRFAETAKTRFVQTIADSYLRGMGLVGAGVSAIKNGILSAVKETKKANADYGNTVIDLLNISPPIGSKVRKLYSASKTYKYNKDVIPEMGFRLDNPATLGVAKVISAFTNLPADRVVQKLLNIKNASNADFENWQRIAMFMGLSNWSVGAKDEKLEAEIDAIEKRVKKGKKKEKKQKEDVNKIEANKKKQAQERKEGKTVMCAAVSKSGNRCKTKVEPGSSYCTVHIEVKQKKGGKKSQCKKIKKGGKRCKMQTSASSGYCYYHD